MPELWLPGIEGPHEEFVEALHRHIERFAREAGVERPYVQVELEDTSRFTLDSVSAEPGFGFITLRPHRGDEPQVPDELVVPIASLRRIELSRAVEKQREFGFHLPNSS